MRLEAGWVVAIVEDPLTLIKMRFSYSEGSVAEIFLRLGLISDSHKYSFTSLRVNCIYTEMNTVR